MIGKSRLGTTLTVPNAARRHEPSVQWDFLGFESDTKHDEVTMYDIRLVKLVNGDMVLGKWDQDKGVITDPAILQTIPTQQGVQMMMLPYGYPFEPEFSGSLEGKNFLYRYASTPKELQDKYIEACTNLTVAGGLGRMQFSSDPLGGSGSGLIK